MKLNVAAALAALAMLCACTSVTSEYPTSRGGGGKITFSTRGQVIAMESLEQLDLGALQAAANELPGGISVKKNGAQLYRLTYWTRFHGQPVVASGLVSIPSEVSRPKGVVLYAHSTTITRALPPSEPGRADGLQETAVFGDNGFIVVLPDYIGLGRSSLP